MKELILIKLGGSVITDKGKEFTARKRVIKRLAGEIKESQKTFSGKIIIGHGGGSFPHTPAVKYQTKDGLKASKNSVYGAAVTEEAARRLNSIVIQEFINQKIAAFPFSPASFLTSDAQQYSRSYIDAIKKALAIDLLPVVYGDVIIDQKQGFTIFSTEKILGILADRLRKDYKIRMIYVTDVDGVYDKKKNTISVVSNKNFKQLRKEITGAKTKDATGGMLHKVIQSLELAKKFGIKTLIVNGYRRGFLRKAIVGNQTPSTLIK